MSNGRERSSEWRSLLMWSNKTIAERKGNLGLAEEEWKNHKLSFKQERYSSKTRLSSYVWHLKSVSSETPKLKWSVWDAYHHIQVSQVSLVFIWKIVKIVTYQKQKELLKERSEFLCKCRQTNNLLLINYTGNEFE